MKRRTFALAGLGLGLTGAGLGVWMSRPQQDAGTPSPERPGVDSQLAKPSQGMRWPAPWELDRPDGQTVAMSSFQGSWLLLNVWATWCPPCVKEMPMLNDFYLKHRKQKVQVLGLAMDAPSAVRDFLKTTPVQFPVVLAGMNGPTILQDLGHPGGQLPLSILFDPQGQERVRHLGALSDSLLENWLGKTREIG